MREVPLVSYLGGDRRVVGIAHINEETGFVEGVVKDTDFARLIRADHVGEVSFGCFEHGLKAANARSAQDPVGEDEGRGQVRTSETLLG